MNVFVAYKFLLLYREKELVGIRTEDLKFCQDISEAIIYLNNSIQDNLIGEAEKHREQYVITELGQEVTIDYDYDYEPRVVEKYGVVNLADFNALKSKYDCGVEMDEYTDLVQSCETCKFFNNRTLWCSQYNDTTYHPNCSSYKAIE